MENGGFWGSREKESRDGDKIELRGKNVSWNYGISLQIFLSNTPLRGLKLVLYSPNE